MTASNTPELLLAQLRTTPRDQRLAMLRARGEPAVVIGELAEILERMAMMQVSEAINASDDLLDAADGLGDAAARAQARRARAQCLAYAGRFQDALLVCQEALKIAEAAGLTFEMGRARMAMVHALVGMARFEEAVSEAEAARDLFASLGTDVWVGRADSSIGGVYREREQPEEALRYFARGRPLLGDDAVARAQLDANRGLAHLSLDQFTEAEQAFQAALDAFHEQQMHWASAIVENNLALLATRQGRLHTALRWFERAQRHLDGDRAAAELSRLLVEHADALMLLGLHEQALKQYRQALPVLERHGQTREATQARAGIGVALVPQGDLERADETLAAAGEAYKRLGQNSQWARVCLRRAALAFEADDLDGAESLAHAAEHELRQSVTDRAGAANLLARVALRRGQLQFAAERIEKAVADARELQLAPLLAESLETRGCVRWAEGKRDEALADYRAATNEVERVRGALQAERFRQAFHGQRLSVYTRLVDAALTIGTDAAVANAFMASEQAKSRALLDLVQNSVENSGGAGDAASDALLREVTGLHAELNALYSRLADAEFQSVPAERVATWRERIRARQRRLDQLQGRLSATGGVAGLYAQAAPPTTVQAALTERAALVEYFAIDDEVIAFVVRSDSIRFARGLGKLSTAVGQIGNLQFHIRRALRPGGAAQSQNAQLVQLAQKPLRALHDQLIAPVAAFIQDCDRLIVVPHGPLHALPFHALHDGQRYLTERYEMSYAPSASLFAALSSGNRACGPEARALVVGVADEHAPRIDDEARAVAALLGAEFVLLGENATTEAVCSALKDTRVVHFACHGHFSPETPQSSGLRLADRWWTLDEIYRQQLGGALVTLSGCETGRHAVSASDELLGLARGFLGAGAGGLIMSQWAVHDESTLELMRLFYNYWIQGQGARTAAAALRYAQREMMRKWAHPAHWAPFFVIGDV